MTGAAEPVEAGRRSWWSGPLSPGSAAVLVVLAVVVLVIVCLPRFGGDSETAQDWLTSYRLADGRQLDGLSIDMREYLHATEYFAGDASAPHVGPFTYRWGVPFIAGQLPFSAEVSLNLVVVSFLALGVAALVSTLRHLRVRCGPAWLCTLLYVVAFPVYYWGSFNFVDGAMVGIVTVFLALLVRDERVWALVVFALALLVKESALICLPLFVTWVWSRPPSRPKKEIWTGAVAVVAVVGFVVARLIGPTATSTYYPWFPSPSQISRLFGFNIGRPGPMAQVFVSAAVPAAMTLLAVVLGRRGDLDAEKAVVRVLFVGVGFAVLLNLQALFAAYWDGRTIWMAYPFALTLGGLALSSPRFVPAQDDLALRS